MTNADLILRIAAIVVTTAAAVAAVFSARAARDNATASRANVIYNLQNFVLQKSKDVNVLWKNHESDIVEERFGTNPEFMISPFASEIVITRNILRQWLFEVKLEEKEQFILHQFWEQLNTSLRLFLQNPKTEKYADNKILVNQVNYIKELFKPYMQ